MPDPETVLPPGCPEQHLRVRHQTKEGSGDPVSKGIREHFKNTHIGGESIQKAGGPVHEGCGPCSGDSMQSNPVADTREGAKEAPGSPKLGTSLETSRGAKPI
jgi:hypothetical protein